MPSIFKTKSGGLRSRTLSSPAPGVDELGRVVSHGLSESGRATPTAAKSKGAKKRRKHDEPEEPLIPDGTFVGFALGAESTLASSQALNTYSFLAPYPTCTLSLPQLAVLVDVVCGELGARGGITTPFVFSPLAIGLEHGKLTRLVRVFVEECGSGRLGKPGSQWLDEARFSEPYELGMCLRWGLARVGRTKSGQVVKGAGLLDWEWYLQFRDGEQASSYQPDFFAACLPQIDPTVRTIVLTLLSLLTRLTANSQSSGHTPPTLAALFGVLVFGCPAGDFEGAYSAYLLATNALEHVLLAFIRWQDHAPGGMGVPTRLKEWIRHYADTAGQLAREGQRPQPRKGARTVRVQSVRRNVQRYSEDLVRGCVGWGNVGTPGPTSLAASRIWDRITSAGSGEARYSESYRKKMNLGSDRVDGSALLRSSSSSTTASTSSSITLSTDRFGSLTDLKWGEFESIGFGESVGEKLEFDLTESLRKGRTAKRQTLTWNDFSAAGFSRTDDPLSATLQFSPTLSLSNSTPPPTPDKKLKKHQPKGGWDFDTTPVMGPEMVVEEAFVDVFCELICGSRWEEFSADERDCNWALVEFKCLAPEKTAVMLFEEYIPTRQPKERKRLASLFSSSNASTTGVSSSAPTSPVPPTPKKTPGITIPRKNGVGMANVGSAAPPARGSDFEGLLTGEGTKFVSLSSGGSPVATAPAVVVVVEEKKDPRSVTPTQKKRTLPTVLSPKPKPNSKPTPKSKPNRDSWVPAEYSAVDFRPAEREDAWVDILVESSARRLGRQEYNPDQASLEVQRALEGVRLEDDDVDVDVDGEVEVEVQHVPREPSRAKYESAGEQDEDEPEPYHPEKDIVSMSDGEEDYPPSRLTRTDDFGEDSGDDDGDGDGDGESELLSQIRRRRQEMGSYFERHPDRRPASSATDEQSIDDVTPKRSYDNEDGSADLRRRLAEDDDEDGEEDEIIAVKDAAAQGDGDGKAAEGENGKSKTAALIEMYREKERAGTGAGLRPLPTPPAPGAGSGNPATPSPERYIHGAPLHNVLEEEEETN